MVENVDKICHAVLRFGRLSTY